MRESDHTTDCLCNDCDRMRRFVEEWARIGEVRRAFELAAEASEILELERIFQLEAR